MSRDFQQTTANYRTFKDQDISRAWAARLPGDREHQSLEYDGELLAASSPTHVTTPLAMAEKEWR